LNVLFFFFFLRSAVGGGTDLVGDVDATLAGENGCVVSIESGDAGGGGFQAVANRLAVRGGLCGGVEGPDSDAARRRHHPTLGEESEAWSEGTCDLAARDGMCRGCRQQHQAQHGNEARILEAGHGNNSKSGELKKWDLV